mmetsp:Transcript_477/g.1308  ORF Transcript_477/g.1308 Transcript_477/m.1308 type:complete len:232 (-) Transcript_477:105-800(-)
MRRRRGHTAHRHRLDRQRRELRADGLCARRSARGGLDRSGHAPCSARRRRGHHAWRRLSGQRARRIAARLCELWLRRGAIAVRDCSRRTERSRAERLGIPEAQGGRCSVVPLLGRRNAAQLRRVALLGLPPRDRRQAVHLRTLALLLGDLHPAVHCAARCSPLLGRTLGHHDAVQLRTVALLGLPQRDRRQAVNLRTVALLLGDLHPAVHCAARRPSRAQCNAWERAAARA